MALPPVWKIRRELRSTLDQAQALVLQLFFPLIRPLYDRKELADLQVHVGQAECGTRLVLYLVFQPLGLPRSHYLAIEEFLRQGHTVMVVSNGRLVKEDRERLQSLCWRVLERENTGYDFGGYRCGFHYLKQQGFFPEVLSLVNDSVWFPVVPDDKTLVKTECVVRDFGGAVCLDEAPPRKGSLVLSYWLTFRRMLLQSESFQEFWRQYVPTDSKTLAVKLGERGLSRYLHDSGWRAEGLYTKPVLMDTLRHASGEDLRRTLLYAAYTDSDFVSESQQLLSRYQSSESWRLDCLAFIEKVAGRRNWIHSFCYAAVGILGVPFLKKNNLRLQVLMREQYIRAVHAGHLPRPSDPMLSEIEASVSSRRS